MNTGNFNFGRMRARHVFPVGFGLLAVGIFILSAPAVRGQVPNLTAGGVPSSTKNLNLGPTGMNGWLYHVSEDSSASRQILVQTVAAGSPADGVMAAGDVILGANGTGATPANFSADARRALAEAINDAEARNPAELKLLRWRAGVTTTVTLTLQAMGSYSASAPYNCTKSALILQRGLDFVMANQNSGYAALGALALMAANNPADPNNHARLSRAQQDILALLPSHAEIDKMMAGYVSTESKISWTAGHKLIVLSEYYLLTNDPQVLPAIEAYAVMLANGQSHLGTMGHQLTSPAADGSYNQAYNVGYGVVNSAGMPCFLGLLMAKKCGVQTAGIDPAIQRASRFFAAYAGYGAHPYGEHEPSRNSHESNGKSGLAAICFSLQGNRVEEGNFYARMATAAASEREIGHTGPWFNYLWAPLGAASGGEDAAISHFSRIRWHLDLCRRWDGGFAFNNLYPEGGDGGGLDWRSGFAMYTPALLTYALPLRQLVITGKGHDSARWLGSTEVAQAAFADTYDAATRSTNELLADLGTWSPKVQKLAAEELGNRTAEHASLVPQLIAIAHDTDAGEQRVGACFALGEIASGSAAADLANLLDDPFDEVRFASAQALRYLPQVNRMAQVNTIMQAAASTSRPFLPIDEDDPLQFAHERLCMLLFYSGNAYGPKGVIWGNQLTGIDRNLLYPAIRAVAQNPNGLGRSTLSQTYPYLTSLDVDAVSGALIDSVQHRAPADKMFSGGVRRAGLDRLYVERRAEGVPLARIVVQEQGQQTDIRQHALGVLEQYAGSSNSVNPHPGIQEFCELLVFTDPYVAADAQLVLNAMAADATPDSLAPFKSITSISADESILTLPSRSTQLHVGSSDLAGGQSIYTWRKVHGAGRVSFYPNGTADAANTNVVFDGVAGKYLFEVTMSDSRGLTEVSDAILVTLHQAGGGLPANAPPTANPQSISIPQATTTPVGLTGVDPEGYPLNFSIITPPAKGRLAGTPPYITYTSDFSHTGTDSFSFMVTDSEGQTDTATVDITVNAITGLGTSVYEPFDYPAGLLNGKSGSSEIGFAAAWSAHAESSVASGSAGYGSLFTKGGRFESTNTANRWGGSRSLSSAALAEKGLLNDGSTLWFSAVLGYTASSNYTNARLGLALSNSGFTTSNNNFYINNDGAQLGSGVGIMLRAPGTGGASGRVQAVQYRDQSKGTGTNGVVTGSWEGTGTTYTVGQHGLVVGRITWSPDPEEPDIIEIFQPGTNMQLPSSPASKLSVVVDQSTFDTLTFARSDLVVLDEVRFGPNYHSVLLGNQSLAADTTAPTPNPPGFAVPPTVVNGTSVTMTAATAYDSSGVEYYFTCTAGGGKDSGWQSGTTYTDSGLSPGVQYSYTVTARDLSPGKNATTASAASSVTLPSNLGLPDIVGMQRSIAELVVVDQGFQVGAIRIIYSATVPIGEVISQNPTAGSIVAVGSDVDLVISGGTNAYFPMLASTSIVDNRAGAPLAAGNAVIYTVTFSEDMDHTTIAADDFGNAGTATVTIGAVTETRPGKFSVAVTPNNSGTLQLRVRAAAVLRDATGTLLDTSTAIADDTTIVVISPYAAWMANHPELIGSTPTTDTDVGGMGNALEWVLGGNPGNEADDSAIRPSLDNTDPNFLIFTHRRADAAVNGATIGVVYSSDLTSWQDAVHDGTDVIITPYNDAAGVGVDLIEVRIHRSMAVGKRLFARLKVVVAP